MTTRAGRIPPVLGAIAILFLVAATATACRSASGGHATPDTTSQLAFPVHDEPLGTDLGFDYLAGELKVADGCLKLYRMGWDAPNRSVSEQLNDIWLPCGRRASHSDRMPGRLA